MKLEKIKFHLYFFNVELLWHVFIIVSISVSIFTNPHLKLLPPFTDVGSMAPAAVLAVVMLTAVLLSFCFVDYDDGG